MNCPNCGVYNPEDRTVCWRCDKPLPRPEPEKRRNPQRVSQVWLYVALATAIVIPLLRLCGTSIQSGG
jgi:predicted nucleic acid-binding Zn ribbon protein